MFGKEQRNLWHRMWLNINIEMWFAKYLDRARSNEKLFLSHLDIIQVSLSIYLSVVGGKIGQH